MEPMLDLRPNCEYCDKDLPPSATDAMICSYECTFCEKCVADVLHNVCPNCGGGFAPRPIRPTQSFRSGACLSHQPASNKRIITKYSDGEIDTFCRSIAGIEPHTR